MEVPKLHSYEELLHMVRTLDQDNTRLRNNVIECNDEIFTLKAVAASVEAELRYSTEKELLKIGSELKFRSKELETLSKDHERVLKELTSMKQHETSSKKLSQTTPIGNGLGLMHQRRVVAKPSLEGAVSGEMDSDFTFSQPDPPAPARTAPAAATSTLHMKPNNIETNQAKSTTNKGLGTVSPRSRPEQQLAARAVLPAVDRLREAAEQRMQTIARDFELMLVFIKQGGCIDWETVVQESVLAATLTLRTLQLVQVDSIVQFVQEALRLGETLLSTLTHSRGVAASLLSIQYLLCVLSALVSELIAFLPNNIQGKSDKTSDSANATESTLKDVVGNLENKFEKASTGTVKDGEGSERALPAVTSVSISVKPRDLVLQSLKTPGIKEEDRRAALEASVLTIRTNQTEVSVLDSNKIHSCLGKYAEFLSSVLKLCSSQRSAQTGEDATNYQQLLQHCAWAGAEAFAHLQFCKDAYIEYSLYAVFADSLSAAVQPLRTLLSQPWSPLTVKAASAQYLGGVACLSKRCFQVLVAHEREVLTQSTDTEDSGILGIMVMEIIQPLTDSHAHNMCRCQMLLVLLQLLKRYRSEFVLLLLRVWPLNNMNIEDLCLPGAVTASGKVKKRRRTDAEIDAASSNSSSSSSQLLNGALSRPSSRSQALGGGTTGKQQAQVTPSHQGSNRAGMGRRDSISASGTCEGNRFTPSSVGLSGGHSSSQRSSLRRRDGGGQLDLRDRLPQVRRHLVTLLAQFWMRLIRHLDCTPSPSAVLDNQETPLKVRMLHLLNALLSGVLDLLNHHDCEYILSDCTDVFHEYIYRCNTSSWNPVLKMPEALFGFLENRNNESAT